MGTDSLAQLPVHALAAKLKSRDISPVDIVDACLDRIAAWTRSCMRSLRSTTKKRALPQRPPTRPSARAMRSVRCTASR